MSADDSCRLYSEDRSRFLALHLEFLRDRTISRADRIEEAAATVNAIRQVNLQLDLPDGQ